MGALIFAPEPIVAQLTKLRASFAGTTGYHLPTHEFARRTATGRIFRTRE
jgi:hypothetical protein